MARRALSSITRVSILRGLAGSVSGSSTKCGGFIVLIMERLYEPHRALQTIRHRLFRQPALGLRLAASESMPGFPLKAGVEGGHLFTGLLISGTATTNKVRQLLTRCLDAPTTPLSHLHQ